MNIEITTKNNSRKFKLAIDGETIMESNPFDMLSYLHKKGVTFYNPLQMLVSIKKDVYWNYGYAVTYCYEYMDAPM